MNSQIVKELINPNHDQLIPMLLPGASRIFDVVASAKRKPVTSERFLSKEERESIVRLTLERYRYVGDVARQFSISTRRVIAVISEHYRSEMDRARNEGYLAGLAGRKPLPPNPHPGIAKRWAA